MKLVKFNEPVTFSNLLDDFFTNSLAPAYHDRSKTTPSVNISESDNEYEIELAAPGKEKQDFKIGLEGDVLTISCERKDEDTKSDKVKNYSCREFSYSYFSRSFNLTDDIDREKIEANYDKGILKVVLPKKTKEQEAEAVKMIDVK